MKTVYTNARIYTMDPDMPWAEEMVVEDKKITYVGITADTIGDEIIDCGGKMIMPGFIDAHAHPGFMNKSSWHVKMPLFDTIEDVLEFIRAYAEKHPKEEMPFLYFDYYATELFGNELPTKELLDSVVSDRPVLVQEFSEHVSWLNSKMLELMGIDRNYKDRSELSVYVRDENGEPTGCVKEGAWFNDINTMFENMGWYPPNALLKENMKVMYEKMSSFGITSVVNAFIEDEEELKSAYELDVAGELNMHYEASLRWDDLSTLDEGIALAKEYQKKYTTDNVKMKTMKIFIDGTMTTGNVGLLDPLSNDPDGSNCGTAAFTTKELIEYFMKCNEAGLDVHIHTAGDASFRHICDATEYCKKNLGGDWKIQIIIAHVGVVKPVDILRPMQLGITLNMTPHWMGGYFGDSAIEYIGLNRWISSVACKDIIDTGVTCSFSSDTTTLYEFDRAYPFFGMEIAHTRKDIQYPLDSDKYPFGICPPMEDRLPLDTIIRCYTIEGAKQMGLADVTGSLKAGKSADFIIVSDNCFEIPKTEIHNIQILKTVFEGKTVYEGVIN